MTAGSLAEGAPGTSVQDLTAVRQWAVNWLAGGDVDAAQQCLAEDYVLQIGAFTLTPRSAYVDGTVTQLARYPGLGVTVHDLITDGRRTVVRLSEHGSSVRNDGATASWRVVAVFEQDGGVITRGWAEEDYWGRRRQLAAGTPDPVDRPAIAPWSTAVVAAEPGVAEVVRDWIESGAAQLAGVLRDDEDLVASYDLPATGTSGAVDVLVVSGRRAGFHAVLQATTPDGSMVPLPIAGLVEVAEDGSIAGHLVTDRLGLPRASSR